MSEKPEFDPLVLQPVYDHALENKTTLYSEYVEPIEDQLKEKFGDKYNDIISLFLYSSSKFDTDNGLYTNEDIFKMKIFRILKSVCEIYFCNKNSEEEIEKKMQEENFWA